MIFMLHLIRNWIWLIVWARAINFVKGSGKYVKCVDDQDTGFGYSTIKINHESCQEGKLPRSSNILKAIHDHDWYAMNRQWLFLVQLQIIYVLGVIMLWYVNISLIKKGSYPKHQIFLQLYMIMTDLLWIDSDYYSAVTIICVLAVIML